MRRKDYTFTYTYKDVSDRKKKNLAILECIRKKGPVSRTDISKETGINIVSVSNYTIGYVKNGLVLECGLDISTGGRRPELLKLNLENAYVLGIDIGPEKLTAVITDLALEAKSRTEIPRPKGPMEEVIKGALAITKKAVKESGISVNNIKLAGIGASGIIDILSGTIHDTDPTRGRTKTDIFRLARSIEEELNVPAYVGNDALCAAYGELSLSQSTDIMDMLYIYSDVGCGIIINGDIYCGATGSAGEIQLMFHNKKLEMGNLAAYGIRGLDLGVADAAREIVEKGGAAHIAGLVEDKKENIKKETIIRAAEQGDRVAKELLANAAQWLGVKAAYLINIFNPQVVIIGGGMEEAGGFFMEPLIDCARMYAFEESFKAVKIMPSFLREKAVSLGAAALAVRELFLNT